MAKRQGNKDRMTFNYGHDVAKTRLSSKLKNNGFDIYEIRKIILNNTEIQLLQGLQAIKIGKIIGQNFVIGCKDELLSKFRAVNAVNKGVTVVQVVNNILNRELKDYGFKNYGKTQYWKTLDPNKYTYNKRIQIGADILTLNFIRDNYSKAEFTCKLSDKQKYNKYQKGF